MIAKELEWKITEWLEACRYSMSNVDKAAYMAKKIMEELEDADHDTKDSRNKSHQKASSK